MNNWKGANYFVESNHDPSILQIVLLQFVLVLIFLNIDMESCTLVVECSLRFQDNIFRAAHTLSTGDYFAMPTNNMGPILL